MLSTFFDPSFSLRRLRTTPARKPRTECCCQPVAFIIASIVAPAGDRSIATTCDCLECDSACLGLRPCCVVFVAAMAEVATRVRFLADFDTWILHSVGGGLPPHYRSPTSALEPAGQDLSAPWAPGIDRSTARIAADCQSFLQSTLQ